MPAIFRAHGALPQWIGEWLLLPCSCRYIQIVNTLLQAVVVEAQVAKQGMECCLAGRLRGAPRKRRALLQAAANTLSMRGFSQPTAKEAHHAAADHPLQVAPGLIAFAASR